MKSRAWATPALRQIVLVHFAVVAGTIQLVLVAGRQLGNRDVDHNREEGSGEKEKCSADSTACSRFQPPSCAGRSGSRVERHFQLYEEEEATCMLCRRNSSLILNSSDAGSSRRRSIKE